MKFMKTLRYKAKPDSGDFTEIVYYMLLQGRIDEALAFFKRIPRETVDTKIQYDYLKTYLDFYLGNLKSVRDTALKYAGYPVPKWQKRFKAALEIIDELEGKKPEIIDSKDRQEQMEALAATGPFLDFEIESRFIKISYKNIEKCRINYYPMDIELLFSKNPFMKQNSEQFTFIRPGRFDIVDLPSAKTKLTLEIPEEFSDSNLMVEITAKGIRKFQTIYAGSMDARIAENYGQLAVSEKQGGKPLAGVYVKVYARMKNGSTEFYKDGYTDVLGRFDYASLTTDKVDLAEKFALLIMSDIKGAMIREVYPPKR
jgi:tetratricopeptide (TPR) repeat protein